MTQTIERKKTITLNGLDPAAIEKTAAGVAESPERGIASFSVRSEWKGGTLSESRVKSYRLGGQEIPREHVIRADEPHELFGDNHAPNPQELILSAVASCMAVGYVFGATSAGIRLDRLELEVEGTLDLRGAFGLDPNIVPGFPEIRCRVHIAGDGTPEQFEAIHQEVMQTSPNYFHLTQAIRLQPELVVE